MKLISKRLTDKCFILNCYKTGKALHMVKYDDGFSFIGKSETFKTIDELAKSIDSEIVEPVETSNQITEIDGYPIKHDEVYNVGTRGIFDITIPTYTTKKDSSVRFAAGYYAIKSSDSFTQILNPKVQTLIDSEKFVGPFKTILEVNHQITIENRV